MASATTAARPSSSISASVLDEDDGLTAGYDADIGVYVGPPNYLAVMARRGQHKQRLCLIAANSSWLPPEVMEEAARYCTGLLAPSTWAANVLRQHSLGLPVMIWRHGVDGAFNPDGEVAGEIRERCADKHDYRALHLSSTRLARKGTSELIAGWCKAKAKGWLGCEASLDLVLSGDEDDAKRLIAQAAEEFSVDPRIVTLPRMNLSAEDMAVLYRKYDLVCQPSRAEGFGMCPLEARACGVPVCATSCTGHADHIHQGLPGVVVIRHGADTTIDDGPDALAPRVTPKDIAEALQICYAQRWEVKRWASIASSSVGDDWSWGFVTKDFLEQELGEG